MTVTQHIRWWWAKPAHIVSAGTGSYVGGAAIPDKLVTRDVKTAASQQRCLQLDLWKMEKTVALLGSLVLVWSCGATFINKPCPSNHCPAYRLKDNGEVGSSRAVWTTSGVHATHEDHTDSSASVACRIFRHVCILKPSGSAPRSPASPALILWQPVTG